MNFDNLIVGNNVIYLHTNANHVFDGVLEKEDLTLLTKADNQFFFINGPMKVKG